MLDILQHDLVYLYKTNTSYCAWLIILAVPTLFSRSWLVSMPNVFISLFRFSRKLFIYINWLVISLIFYIKKHFKPITVSARLEECMVLDSNNIGILCSNLT